MVMSMANTMTTAMMMRKTIRLNGFDNKVANLEMRSKCGNDCCQRHSSGSGGGDDIGRKPIED